MRNIDLKIGENIDKAKNINLAIKIVISYLKSNFLITIFSNYYFIIYINWTKLSKIENIV